MLYNPAKQLPKGLRLTTLALTIASVISSPGYAQGNNAEYNSTPEEIEIIGQPYNRDPASTRFTRPMLDTAQTINVIPKNLIEERSATTLRDVLRNVSGISMQAGEGGTPAGDQLSIRGHSAMTDIFVDNVRDFGGYTRDPFNLEQVEVVKGPSSDYSGRGSTGGSINLVSKAPTLENNASSNIGIGSDNYGRVSLDINRALQGNTAGRLNLLYHEQDTAGRDEVNTSRWGIAPSLAFGLETDTSLTLSLFHLQQDNLPDYGIPWVAANNVTLAAYADQAPPVDFSNWYGLLQRDFEEVSTTMATARIDHTINSNLSVSNIARWGITDRDSMITAPRFLTDTAIRRSDEKYRDQEDEILSNQTNLRWDIRPGETGEQRILFGLELNKENELRYSQALTGIDSPATDLFNPTPQDAYLENYQRTGGFSKADSRSVAVYASDSIQVSEKWQINGGLRWDSFQLDYTPDGGTPLDRTDNMLSYRAGLVYKPVREGSVYLGYGTSFNPSAETLSLTNSSRSPGLPDLDPEESRTIELGIKWELLDRRVFATAALFRTDKHNARTQDPTDPNDLLVLEGEQRVQGFELGLSGSLNDAINVSAGYTFLDTEIRDSLDITEIGKELGNSPQNSFNLWGTHDVLDNLQFGLGAQFVDDRFNSIANTRIAPSYWVYELSAAYMVNERLNFRLNIQNLTDEEYIDYVGGGHFIPGLGRVAMLNTTFSF